MSDTSAQSPLTSKDLAIAVLAVTAVILLVAFLATQFLTPRQALGFGQNLALPGGDYQLLTAQIDNTTEILIIVNHRTFQMNAYGFDIQRQVIAPIRQLDLSRLPGRTGGTARPNQPQQKKPGY